MDEPDDVEYASLEAAQDAAPKLIVIDDLNEDRAG
jgi:hypothetical protein